MRIGNRRFGTGGGRLADAMSNSRRAALSAAICVLAIGGPVEAQVEPIVMDTVWVDLEEAWTLAAERSPDLAARAARIEIARGDLRRANTYSMNPEVEIELPGAFEGPERGRYEAGLTQEIEWAGQPGLRSDEASAAFGRSRSEYEEAARRTQLQVTSAYLRTVWGERRVELARILEELGDRLLDAVQVQSSSGEISRMEANLAQVEVARSRARVLSLGRDLDAAAIELGRLLGFSPATTVRAGGDGAQLTDPSELIESELVSNALDRRPDLRASSLRIEEADARARLARRAVFPPLSVGPVFEGGGAGQPTEVGIALSVPIPLWNRRQGDIDRGRAELTEATLEREAAELRVRAEVTTALRAYLNATREVRVLEELLLDPVRDNQSLLDTAYREGEVDLASLVILRNELVEAELDYWDAWLARHQAWAELEAASGAWSFDTVNPTGDTIR